MDFIKIAWLTDEPKVFTFLGWTTVIRTERAAFEVEVGDIEAASRIFERLTQIVLKEEKEENNDERKISAGTV